MDKLKIIISFLIITLINSTIFAQSNLDSLLNEEKKGKKRDTLLADLFNNIGFGYYTTDLNLTKDYATKALILSDSLNYTKGKAEAYRILGIYYLLEAKYDSALIKLNLSKKTLKNTIQKDRLAATLNIIAITYKNLGNYETALNNYLESLKIYEKTENTEGIAAAYNNIAILSYLQNDYEQCLLYHKKGLDLIKNSDDKFAISRSYNNLGGIYRTLKKNDSSLYYYRNAIAINMKLNKKLALAHNFAGIAETFDIANQYDSAYTYYKKAIKIQNELGLQKEVSNSYIKLANHFRMQNMLKKSLNYGLKGLKIATFIKAPDLRKEGNEILYKNYSDLNDYKNAFFYQSEYYNLKDSLINLESSKKLNQLIMQYEFNKKQKETEIQNQLELNQQKYINYGLLTGAIVLLVILFIIIISFRRKKKDNMLLRKQRDEISRQSKELKLVNNELEKLSIVASETDNAVLICKPNGDIEWMNRGAEKMHDMSLNELIRKKGKNLIESSTNSKIASIITDCLTEKKSKSYESYIKKSNGEKIWTQTTITPIISKKGEVAKLIAIDSNISKLKFYESEILQKNSEIQAQRDELWSKNEQITIQNEHIKSSLNYAQTIQDAILPADEQLKNIGELLKIYLPKDIVSGDFYWTSQTPNYQFIAVVDCTGHGVPGAFMSMISNTLLNEIVNVRDIHQPSEILSNLNKLIVRSLNQETTQNIDGMDITLCKIDKINKKLTIASAKHAWLIYKNQTNEITRFKGNRFSIGGYKTKHKLVFSEQVFETNTNDILYIYSDGYIDQSNEKRKRFGSKRLISLLQQNISLDMQKQEKILKTELYNWMQNTDQRDDITILGFRF